MAHCPDCGERITGWTPKPTPDWQPLCGRCGLREMRGRKKMTPDNKPAEEIKAFFASGSKGNEVRADGQGGFLKRGHYWRDEKGKLHGPFRGARIRNLNLKRHLART